ncbi:MAG: hypothetical protein L6Q59_14855, partial [Ignavibacteriaceae bacterium]|nr:hypothetical protein [Ignavibacteriaceae bacterium]
MKKLNLNVILKFIKFRINLIFILIPLGFIGCSHSWVPDFEGLNLERSTKTIAYPRFFVSLECLDDLSFLVEDEAVRNRIYGTKVKAKDLLEFEVNYPNKLTQAIASALDSIMQVAQPVYEYMNVNSPEYLKAKEQNDNSDYHLEVYYQGFNELPEIAISFDRQVLINYVLTDKNGKVIWSEAVSPIYTTEFLEKVGAANAGAVKENIKEMIIK